MNIAIDITRATEERRTGIHNYQYYLFKHLLQIDNSNNYYPFFYFSNNNCPERFLDKKILCQKINFELRSLLLKKIFDRIYFRKCISDKQIDIVHGTAYVNVSGLENKTIITIHDLIFMKDKDSFDSFFTKMINDSIKKVKKIIAISETTKREILEQFPNLKENKIKVIYQGVSDDVVKIEDDSKLAQFNRSTFNDEKIQYILYLGSFIKRKNIISLIKAYDYILKKYNFPHKLVIAGKPLGLTLEMNHLINRLGLCDRVIIKEYFPYELISYLLSAADLFVFPSYYEGFGLPILEAMKCGVPVVTSNIPCMKELFSDSALIIDPYDIKAIGEAILKLLENKELRKRFILAGLDKSKAFTWKSTAQETAKLYEEM